MLRAKLSLEFVEQEDGSWHVSSTDGGQLILGSGSTLYAAMRDHADKLHNYGAVALIRHCARSEVRTPSKWHPALPMGEPSELSLLQLLEDRLRIRVMSVGIGGHAKWCPSRHSCTCLNCSCQFESIMQILYDLDLLHQREDLKRSLETEATDE